LTSGARVHRTIVPDVVGPVENLVVVVPPARETTAPAPTRGMAIRD
jgi:hypothetical protein